MYDSVVSYTRGDIMPSGYSYRVFARYMELNRIKYNQNRFKQEDMYFCKVWKPQRSAFADVCKKYKCERVFIDLNERCCEYENKLLKIKLKTGQIDTKEFSDLQRIIYKDYL